MATKKDAEKPTKPKFVIPVPPEDDEGMPLVDMTTAERLGRRSALVVIAEAALTIENTRVGAQVRLRHLTRRQGTCVHTAWLYHLAREYEAKVDRLLAKLTRDHPAAPWFNRVKGTGGEAIGKALGYMEAFGRYYNEGDPMIPSYVTRAAVPVPVPIEFNDDGEPMKFETVSMVWVEGIERWPTPSKLRKYAGLAPGQKAEAGKPLDFNRDLRTMMWRLGTSLLKAQGKYSQFYYDYRKRLEARLEHDGNRILSTPKGRLCMTCHQEAKLKYAKLCPSCGGALALKTEPPGVYWVGHVHAMCVHRMLQLFLDHLWVAWREALGLPLRDPYPIEYLHHTQVIRHWDMVDYATVSTGPR